MMKIFKDNCTLLQVLNLMGKEFGQYCSVFDEAASQYVRLLLVRSLRRPL